MLARYQPDVQAYSNRIQNNPCFICQIINDNPDYPHHIVFEDDVAIAFLDHYPALYGHTLVAPKGHLEQVTGDFGLEDYLQLSHGFLRTVQPQQRHL